MTSPHGSGYQQAAAPGWYPDPCGDYEQRWWDGARWTDEVATGLFRGQDAMPAPGEPLLPATESTFWQTDGWALSTHRVWIREHRNQPPTEFAVWMVRAAQVRSHVGDVADVGVTIAFPGYGGKATWVLRSVAQAPVVAATLLRQANRARRATAG